MFGRITERCVCCGREIPEGRQYCVICERAPKNKRQIDRILNMSVDEMAKAIAKNISTHEKKRGKYGLKARCRGSE